MSSLNPFLIRKFLLPEKVKQLNDLKFVSELFDQLVVDKTDVLKNEEINSFFYEFIFLLSSNQISVSIAGSFFNHFVSLAGLQSAELVTSFTQMLNFFTPSPVLQSFLRYLTKYTYLLQRFLLPAHYFDLKTYRKVDTKYKILVSDIEQYQLLHESSEGYSKLIVELYETATSKDSLFMVEYLNKAILKLIGTYKLDPNRILDISLDVFANLVFKNYRFIVNFYKKSSWWPKNLVKSPGEFESMSIQNKGNKAFSQLVGLKILNYDSENSKANCPDSLKLLIGILIKEGFISLSSIWAYLKPSDNSNKLLHDKYSDYMEEKISSIGASALALAAPLKDEDQEETSSTNGTANGASSSIKSQDDSKYDLFEDETIPEPLGKKYNFKYELTKVFLICGLYNESIFMLSKFPAFAEISDEICNLIHRMFSQCIDDWYFGNYHPVDKDTTAQMKERSKIPFTKDHNFIDYENVNVQSFETHQLHKQYGSKKFTFFYYEWLKNLPVINNVDSLFKVSNELLVFTGPKLANDPSLILKLCRIGAKELLNATDEMFAEVEEKWFQFFRKFIFPTISLLGSNYSLIESICNFFKMFSTQRRFNLYGELEMKLSKKNKFINYEYDRATKSAKDGIKRLSKDNEHLVIRGFSKIVTANPLPFFQVIIKNIESYANLIDLVIKSGRYYNSYAWDTLTYVLLKELTNRKNLVQNDWLSERLWLQNLANFIGKLSLNFPSKFNTLLITEFAARRLYDFDSVAVTILKDLWCLTSGIESISNLTSNQIVTLNSGKSSAAKHCLMTIHDKRNNELNKRATLTYVNGMLNDQNSLRNNDADIYDGTGINELKISKLSELFILLTNYQKTLIFLNKTDQNHSKILSYKYDELTSTIHTFLTILNYFSIDLEKNFVDLKSLLVDYDMSVEWSFELFRVHLSKLMLNFNDESEDFVHLVYSPVLTPIMDILSNVLHLKHADFDNTLNRGFFVTFWQLSLYDINFMSTTYKILDRVNLQIKSIETIISSLPEDKYYQKKYEKFHLEKILKELTSDREGHLKHSQAIEKRISLEKPTWFDGEKSAKDQASQFIQFCMLPRILHSSFDAVFCSKFMVLLFNDYNTQCLHEISSESLNILFSEVAISTIFTSTPQEVEDFGLFFQGIFEYLDTLRDFNTYKRIRASNNNEQSDDVEMLSVQDVDESDDVRMSAGNDENDISNKESPQILDSTDDDLVKLHNEFRYQLYEWHHSLFEDVILSIKSDDYMLRRNAITFMKNLLPVFPRVHEHFDALIDSLDEINNTDNREDIKLASLALFNSTKSKVKSNGVYLYDFYDMSNEEKDKYETARISRGLERKKLESSISRQMKLKNDTEILVRGYKDDLKVKEEKQKNEEEFRMKLEQQLKVEKSKIENMKDKNSKIDEASSITMEADLVMISEKVDAEAPKDGTKTEPESSIEKAKADDAMVTPLAAKERLTISEGKSVERSEKKPVSVTSSRKESKESTPVLSRTSLPEKSRLPTAPAGSKRRRNSINDDRSRIRSDRDRHREWDRERDNTRNRERERERDRDRDRDRGRPRDNDKNRTRGIKSYTDTTDSSRPNNEPTVSNKHFSDRKIDDNERVQKATGNGDSYSGRITSSGEKRHNDSVYESSSKRQKYDNDNRTNRNPNPRDQYENSRRTTYKSYHDSSRYSNRR